jgi:site-specific DNA-methyltransferase (adenine-specific)
MSALPKNIFLNADCMDPEVGLPSYPDNHFDLAIVDPPYRDKNQPTKEMRNKINGRMKNFGSKPREDYFHQLFRVSKNQIVWGGNNFIEHLFSTNCFLFWYKRNMMVNYSDGEMAWTSFKSVAKIIPLDHFGAHTSDKGADKIHPTQKPKALYRWLLENYAQPNDLILDTHVGSASSLIACESMGFNYVGYELDPDYYAAAQNRMSKGIQLQML